MIRIVILESQPLFRYGVVCALKDNPDMSVVGVAEHSQAFCRMIADTSADVALISVNTDDFERRVDIIRRLKTEHPNMKILAIANNTTLKIVKSTWNEGIGGFIGKRHATQKELEIAIRRLAAGNRYAGTINGKFSSKALKKILFP